RIPVYKPAQYNQCVWVIGSSGKGKSSSLIHRVQYLAEAGCGVGIFDAHRSTAFAVLGVLEKIAPERIVFLDFDADIPVAYNPFANVDKDSIGRFSTEIGHSLKQLFDADKFYRMSHLLLQGVYGLCVLGANLSTLPDLFSRTARGEGLRRQVMAGAPNPDVQR